MRSSVSLAHKEQMQAKRLLLSISPSSQLSSAQRSCEIISTLPACVQANERGGSSKPRSLSTKACTQSHLFWLETSVI